MSRPFSTPKRSYKETCAEMTHTQKKVWRGLFNLLAQKLYKNIKELRDDISMDDVLSTVQLLWETGHIQLAYCNNPFCVYWQRWDNKEKRYKVWFQVARGEENYEIQG